MASATTGAGWGRDKGPRRTYRRMRTRAYRSQPTAEGRKNQHFPTRRAGQLRPKENHGHTASHSALDTQVSRDSAPGSSHHTKELTSIQQRPLRANVCQDHPPVGSLGEGEGGLGLSSHLSASGGSGLPCPLLPAQTAASVLGVGVRNSFYDSEESNNCESAVVKPAHCLSFLESRHCYRWAGEGGCRAQKPAPPTSQSAACKGHNKPGALVAQAGRATTRFRGPSSGGGVLG